MAQKENGRCRIISASEGPKLFSADARLTQDLSIGDERIETLVWTEPFVYNEIITTGIVKATFTLRIWPLGR